jgi:hypothetical protein
MPDRELIAAILTAGMLPTVEIPQSRAQRRRGPLTHNEAGAIQHAVDHAFGLYRLVLNGLGVDPYSMLETGAQPQPSADQTRNLNQANHPHSEPGAPWEHARSVFADPT